MDNQMNPSISSVALKPAIQRGKITWPDESSQPQNFSLPSSIIYYISKNPSTPTVYFKLAQSCKYFFEKFPLLIAKGVSLNSPFCPNAAKECFNNDGKHCVNIDLTKLASKIWLINKIHVRNLHVNPNYLSLLSSKLYRSDVATLYIKNQNVIYDDFKLIASSVKRIMLSDVKMVYKDGNNVTLDAILEALPNVEEFHCTSPVITSSTMKNITKLQNLTQLQGIWLYDIPENVKVDDYMNVIQTHKHAYIQIIFDKNISEGFENQLNALIDNVIKDEVTNCIIRYTGQDAEKLKIMQKRFY